MGDKDKTLCKWKKGEYEEQFKDLRNIVGKPKYACMKCGRAAKSKKYLCKPNPL